jgi:hypothetical protein
MGLQKRLPFYLKLNTFIKPIGAAFEKAVDGFLFLRGLFAARVTNCTALTVEKRIINSGERENRFP